MGTVSPMLELAVLVTAVSIATLAARHAWTARGALRFHRTHLYCPWQERRMECTVLQRGRHGPILTVTDCAGAPGTGVCHCDRACLLGLTNKDAA